MTHRLTRMNFLLGAWDDPSPLAVDAARCFSARGQPCDYCHARCPERPRAIPRLEPGSAPVVDAARCTGCGVCAELCPAGALRVRAPAKVVPR